MEFYEKPSPFDCLLHHGIKGQSGVSEERRKSLSKQERNLLKRAKNLL